MSAPVKVYATKHARGGYVGHAHGARHAWGYENIATTGSAVYTTRQAAVAAAAALWAECYGAR